MAEFVFIDSRVQGLVGLPLAFPAYFWHVTFGATHDCIEHAAERRIGDDNP